MNQIQKERLVKLVEHLEHGQLGHEVFDFSHFNCDPQGCVTRDCGTNGCAIGELPILFPDHWHFSLGRPRLIVPGINGYNESDSIDDAMAFFGIPINLAAAMFLPSCLNGGVLPSNATKEEVAANIRKLANL